MPGGASTLPQRGLRGLSCGPGGWPQGLQPSPNRGRHVALGRKRIAAGASTLPQPLPKSEGGIAGRPAAEVRSARPPSPPPVAAGLRTGREFGQHRRPARCGERRLPRAWCRRSIRAATVGSPATWEGGESVAVYAGGLGRLDHAHPRRERRPLRSTPTAETRAPLGTDPANPVPAATGGARAPRRRRPPCVASTPGTR